ncbi:MAG TPA: serine hydrolase domain-containing protein [Draconibacterium sp.]|nr:serine hydrolase domain-containing protein [Draconibacterium sp.]
MKIYKYLFILFIVILVAIILQIPSIIGKSEVGKKIIEVTEIDHSKEIREVLNKFDSLYNVNIVQSGAVGGAVVITYKGQVALMKCFGVKKAGENNAIDKNTIFRLASVSKTVTGVLAGILAAENTINLDDKVVDYIPEFRLKFQESTNSITIKHLLSHTSGLVPHAFDIMVEDQVPLEQIMQRLNEVEIVSPPGLVYAYQNVMFSLFDPITAAKTKKSFQTVVKEKVFDPFGMKNASTDFESFQNNENKAFPHQKSENGYIPIKLNNRYYVTAPAAGVNASIADLGQFLIAISGKEDNLFSNEARKIVFTPQIESPLKSSYYKNWDNIGSKHYAIGWRIINYKDHTIAHHGGYVLGYQSEIAVCEQEEVGIAILTNSPNSFFSADVPTFFNLFFEHKNKLAQEKLITEKLSDSKP